MAFKDIKAVNCTTFGLYTNKSEQKMLNNLFSYVTRLKNEFIDYVWDKIYEYSKKDEKFKKSLDIIQDVKKRYKKTVDDNDKEDEVHEAYDYIHSKVKIESELSLTSMRQQFSKEVSKEYNIFIPDDIKYNALEDVIQGFSKMFYYRNGKNVHKKSSWDLLSVRSKPQFSKNKKTGEVNTKESNGSIKLEFDNDSIYIVIWDLREKAISKIKEKYDANTQKFLNKNNICPHHQKLRLKIHYNINNKLQKQIISNIYMGALKIARRYIRGNWRYYLQVNFEDMSPALKTLNTLNNKMAVNIQTETLAFVRDDGYQGLLELSPSTPRVFDEIQKLDIYMDNSRRISNQELYNEDGTIKYNRIEMKQLGLNWKYSKSYIKARNKRKELYRLLTVNRELNNRVIAKKLVELSNNFVFDTNKYKAWGTKQCRMNEKTQEKYSRNNRRDYTKQIHDRAPGYLEARVNQICTQKNFPVRNIKGFNSTMYNHFTKQEDLFTSLKNRLVVFDLNTVSSQYTDRAVSFENTFITVEDNDGNKYLLQRDLYAASKMLYCNSVNVEKLNKKGEKYKTEIDIFDQNGYEKFFKETFYPKHLEYIKYLINLYNLKNVKLNGTILGTNTK